MMSKEQFEKEYCTTCGSQRCPGIYDKEWSQGCLFWINENLEGLCRSCFNAGSCKDALKGLNMSECDSYINLAGYSSLAKETSFEN